MNKDQMNNLIGNSNLMLVEAMKKIDVNAKGILFIVDSNQVLKGVVTDGDIRRWIIRTAKLDVRVDQIMNRNPIYLAFSDKKLSQKRILEYGITALPILDVEHRIVEIVIQNVNEDEIYIEKSLENVSVVVMAGGKGTRLYPYTKILPKPLIPIGEIPIMERIIDRFHSYGVNEFYATVNYKKNMIRSYFSEIERDYDIQYVEEERPLGTAGSVRLIHKQFDRPVIITNCDVLIQADYADIYKQHIASGNSITMVTALKNIEIPYGVVKTQKNGVISSMEEKPQLSYFVNTGMYVVNPETIEKIPENTFFHMTDLTERVMEEGLQVGTYPVSEDSFLDMGEFEEMHRMERKLNIKEKK